MFETWIFIYFCVYLLLLLLYYDYYDCNSVETIQFSFEKSIYKSKIYYTCIYSIESYLFPSQGSLRKKEYFEERSFLIFYFIGILWSGSILYNKKLAFNYRSFISLSDKLNEFWICCVFVFLFRNSLKINDPRKEKKEGEIFSNIYWQRIWLNITIRFFQRWAYRWQSVVHRDYISKDFFVLIRLLKLDDSVFGRQIHKRI